MMVKTKPNQKIHVDKLQTTSEKLGQLKEKPKEELTLRESIYFLRDKLKSALKKGYSYQDLSEILAEQEILISAATLKQYLTKINKQSASRKKRSKVEPNKIQEGEAVNNLDSTSLSEGESSKNNREKELSQSKPKTRKSVRAKSQELLGSNPDLSSEFNQY